MNQARDILEAMKTRPPALEPWKNRKHVRIRQQANDLVASGKLKPQSCQHRGCGVGPANTVKHHVDYDRPDNVKWYCEPHHDQTHAAMDKMPTESCSAKCNTCGQESCRCIANHTTNQSQQIMGMLGEAKKPPSWWFEPSTNAFTPQGWTKGDIIMDWLKRHKVPKLRGKYVFYHAAPKDVVKEIKRTGIRAGSYMTPKRDDAIFFAGRDRGLKPDQIEVFKLVLAPWEINTTASFAILLDDHKVK